MSVDSRWATQRAAAWWSEQPWLVGCNFIPSTASNQLEMWQRETFDPATIDRELEWAADLGFNVVRVYLHDLLWEQDAEGFVGRVEQLLAASQRRDVGVMLVLFDDVWCTTPALGPQPPPVPGRHNSRWLQSPGGAALNDYAAGSASAERLEAYVRGILSRFGDDRRVLLWDLYNEPGGFPSPRDEPMGERCLPLLRDAFAWARDVSPSQPLTSGLWTNPVSPVPESITTLQLEHSDIVSFHHYGPADALEQECRRLRSLTDRPLLCTEYLARPLHSRFETHLPIFREHGIGAISWGLVSGKTQTIHPWWSWFDESPKPEPELWFHDVLRTDGTPFDPAETAFLRRHLGRAG